MRLGWHHWLAASVAAILAHAGMAAVFLVAERSTGETKVAGGEIEVTLSVTAPSTVADTVTAPEVNPVAPTEPEAAETPEIVPEVIEPLDTAEDFATVEDPADYVVGATAEDAPATSPSTTPRTSVGTPVAVDGARNDYFSLLRAWLERHKEYPRNARLKRQEGTVTVRFTVRPSGQLQSYAIEQGSGFALLDREALDMLRRAAPLPAVPEALWRDGLELVLPVSFYLH